MSYAYTPSTVQEVADGLAAVLAASETVAAAAGEQPRVFLADLDRRQMSALCIVVAPVADNVPVRGAVDTCQVVVEVLLDTSAGNAGNFAAMAARPDGVYVGGTPPRRIDEIAQAVLAEIRAANPGALLTGTETSFDYSMRPLQIASITADYETIKTF